MSFKLSDLKKHNSELLKLITEHLPDMLWIKDINGKYIYANQSICNNLLMAKNTQEPIGKDDVFFAHREREAHKDNPDWHTFGELCFNSDLIVIKNNKQMKFEEYGNVKGKMLYLEVYKAPFYDKDGNILGTVGTGRDITELKIIQLDLEEKNKILAQQQEQITLFNEKLEKRVEKEIKKRKKQEKIMLHTSRQAAMGELLESIAHQWRQPLNIIGLASTKIDTQFQMDAINIEEFNEMLKIIQTNINYMSDTIDDFRNFLSPNREIENFSLRGSIEQTLNILHDQIKVNNVVTSIFGKYTFLVNGSENEFKQVMFILLNNSMDAIRANIQREKIQEGKVDINVECKDNMALLSVKDNGGGIAQDDIDSIFDAYFTTKFKAKGTGIGLYIAKSIIEKRMNGNINVVNTDEGAQFTITLPLA